MSLDRLFLFSEDSRCKFSQNDDNHVIEMVSNVIHTKVNHSDFHMNMNYIGKIKSLKSIKLLFSIKITLDSITFDPRSQAKRGIINSILFLFC